MVIFLSMSSSQEALQKAIYYLSKDGKKTQSKLKEVIGAIRDIAERDGLDSDVVETLMQILVDNTNGCGISSRCQLVRTFIPKTTVSLTTILAALGAMGGLPLSLMKLLFQWIVLVYDIIEGRGNTLHALYDVIMHYTQYDELRSIVCQLLCYLTRREDVKKYRVQQLCALQEKVLVFTESSESGLLALLSVYKRYCPHLVKLSFRTRRKTWFKPFEKKLAASVLRIQNQRSSEAVVSTATNLRAQLGALPPVTKKAKLTSYIPTLQSSHHGPSTDRVPVAMLSSFDELCSNAHRLELPGQIATILESKLGCHAFSLNFDPSAVTRLTYWLQYSVGYELDNHTPEGPESPSLLHILNCLSELTKFLLEPLPVVESFLSLLLEVWEGVAYQSQVCALLGHLSLQPFSDLENDFLDPLRVLFRGKDLIFRHTILGTLTTLFRNFVTLEWPRRQQEISAADNTSVSRLNLFHDSLEDDNELDFDPRDTLRQFVGYMGDMLQFALWRDHSHPLIQHSAAGFYQIATDLPSRYGIPLICIPRPLVVYNLLLSPECSALDRMLSSIVSCKGSFSKTKKADRGVEDTHTFNSLVLDLCDALWKNSAFTSEHRPYPTLLFKMSKEQLASYGLHTVNDKLSMIHHPAFLGFVLKFFKETQDPGVGYQPQAIWQEPRFREAYLNYLQHHHLTGLVSFIRHFIREAS